MKTKTQIVQELLDEKKITADDAVILLMGEPKYIPYAQPYPVYPYYPIFPSWQYYPTISTGNISVASGSNTVAY
jgi:hypothetical protein